MKIVISPAKSLNWNNDYPQVQTSTPVFLEDSVKVNAAIKKYSRKKLLELQKISKALADLNWQRNQDWTNNINITLCKPAVFAFDGEVYNGLDILNVEKEKLANFQNNLRILSGLYGILKPLDLIMPYRLEMGTALKIRRRNNLYEFWSENVSKHLKTEMGEDEVLINLASNEYFKVINPKILDRKVVDITFKDFSNGNFKVLSFFAKKARGLMANYILSNKIDTIEALKLFNLEGYYFNEDASTNDNLVFLNDRNK